METESNSEYQHIMVTFAYKHITTIEGGATQQPKLFYTLTF